MVRLAVRPGMTGGWLGPVTRRRVSGSGVSQRAKPRTGSLLAFPLLVIILSVILASSACLASSSAFLAARNCGGSGRQRASRLIPYATIPTSAGIPPSETCADNKRFHSFCIKSGVWTWHVVQSISTPSDQRGRPTLASRKPISEICILRGSGVCLSSVSAAAEESHGKATHGIVRVLEQAHRVLDNDIVLEADQLSDGLGDPRAHDWRGVWIASAGSRARCTASTHLPC